VIRTYIDAGVLLAAARGAGRLYKRALGEITDTKDREFVCSDYVRLEIIPKATYERQRAELKFYADFFSTVRIWLPFDIRDLKGALDEACYSGLSAMDAIHIVAAAGSGCHEIVTSEKPSKPMHRTRLITVRSIDEDGENE